jgi:hypothetical protein
MMMTIRTKVRAGAIATNHNATSWLKMKPKARGGSTYTNHNAKTPRLKIRTKPRVGSLPNEL